MKSHKSLGVAPNQAPVARVGRLTPLPGVAKRAHPDRRQVRQFLKELRLPLAASESMLELIREEALPESVGMALNAVRNHNEFLQRLVLDFCAYGQLEQDTVEPKPCVVKLRDWLDALLLQQQRLAPDLSVELAINYRSFLPSHVIFDGELVAKAIASVLHVAMQRSLPGRLGLAIVYDEDASKGASPQLRIEVATRGGGFSELEQGYVFAPFQVRDAAARPLLGLSLAQRLSELLGGDLRVESPGASVCHYRLSVAAEPAPQAVWLDPTGTGSHLGPVRPGRILFVGRCLRTVERCRGALQREGYSVERVEREELVLARLESEPLRWSAVVVDATCTAENLLGFVDAIRVRGYGAPVVAVVAEPKDAGCQVAGLDGWIYAPNGTLLLKMLQEARAYSERKNATNAS